MIKKRMMSASRDPNYNAKPEEVELVEVLEETEEEREEWLRLEERLKQKEKDEVQNHH